MPQVRFGGSGALWREGYSSGNDNSVSLSPGRMFFLTSSSLSTRHFNLLSSSVVCVCVCVCVCVRVCVKGTEIPLMSLPIPSYANQRKTPNSHCLPHHNDLSPRKALNTGHRKQEANKRSTVDHNAPMICTNSLSLIHTHWAVSWERHYHKYARSMGKNASRGQ